MQRYFVAPEQLKQDQIVIMGDDVHHLKNVMRCQPGDEIICCAGEGEDHLAEIELITAKEVIARVKKTFPSIGEPNVHVTVAQSIPKGDKWEWVLQKGTEIGAVRFVPFISERTIVKIDARKQDKKVERWRKIAKEAAEQAHRGRIPEVSAPLTWTEMLAKAKQAETAWICYEKGGKPLKAVWKEALARDIFLIVGPEGGFTEREVAEALEAGIQPITLGPRILRTETAPLVALTSILFASDDLGGEIE